MRNLRNVHRCLIQSPIELRCTASTWDVGTHSVICAFGPSKENPLLDLRRWHKYRRTYESIAAFDAPPPTPDLENDSILNLHHFSDLQTTCLVLAGGDLILIRESLKDGEDKIEIVGSVDVGISAAEWSPDEELLAITTKASTLLFMTREFENVTDVMVREDDLRMSSHVDVGWGKKETQFKGKGSKAKALRDPTVPENVDKGSLSTSDDGAVSISWRGDGAYLAVNSVTEGAPHPRRVIRVYTREGVLDSVSEPVNGLEGAVSWRPAGNLIAGVQRLDDVLKVVFFERNGLRHGQFELRLNRNEMDTWGKSVRLSWNIDSTVLAVVFADRVQLWTMGNYHYYLKQEISCVFDNDVSNFSSSLVWHPEKPLHFAASSKGVIQRLAYASVVSSSPTASPHDHGIVAVIDGKKLKVTPLRLANIPPPMAQYELDLPAHATDVSTMLTGTSIVLAVLTQDRVSIFTWPISTMSQQEPKLQRVVQVPRELPAHSSCAMELQISAASEDFVMVLQNDINMSCEHLIPIKEDHGALEATVFNEHERIDLIVSRGSDYTDDLLLIPDQSSAAEAVCYLESGVRDDGYAKVPKVASFPVSSSRLEAVSHRNMQQPSVTASLGNRHGSTSERLVLSLAENGSLFANERILVRNCTSFLVTPAHLIFTTSQHLLKFVHLGRKAEDLDVPPDTPETDERCRSIERGARLVTVMPSIFALILQMPRGNLETIYPRALVLAGIRDSINRKKYKKAFLACRTQRVDMNILHDHAPQQFLDNVGLFIDQIKKIEHIDLFLSGLREENVTKTMYQETLEANHNPEADQNVLYETHTIGTSKVNGICNAFLAALAARSGHLQNMISAHVCKQPPDFDAGLIQIAKLRKQKSDQVDAAIEHICFLADVNRLYDNALGLYDLELTLLIAQQSQKDPREYLPFLQNLQKMHDIRRQHSIDDHLKRYSKALSKLCALNVFDEVKAYTIKHNLYTSALEHYRYRDTELSAIMRLYADNLQSEGSFKGAAIAYEYLHDYNLASASYRQAHLWKESLSCALLIPLSDAEHHALAQTLASSCLESHDFYSAATIHYEHLSNIPVAASLFCKGHFYADALRIIALHRRPELLETILDAGLVEGMATMTELLAEMKAQLHAQVPRIRELRAKKAADPLAFYDGDRLDGESGVDIPDNVSLAPTDASTAGGGTLFTRYTNCSSGTLATNATRRSSKNRRREERKRARGKKGSVYEEEYLVASVRRLVERVNTVGDEVGRLVVGLMRRGMRERARAVEGGMVEVVELCQGCIGELFGEGEAENERRVEPESEKVNGVEDMLGNGLGGETKREPPPVVKGFEKLSLLGS